MENHISVILTMYNQKDLLELCLQWLESVKGIHRIILVDNGSDDGTGEILSTLGYDYITFDEGRQGYGTVWNAVIDNFELDETIIFMDIRYVVGRNTLVKLAETVHQKCEIGIAGPKSNGIAGTQYLPMNTVDHMLQIENNKEKTSHENTYATVVGIDSGIWAISKDKLEEIGRFSECLTEAESVMTDYEFRMIQLGYTAIVCDDAIAFDIRLGKLNYGTKDGNINNDRKILKEKWNMNYFNRIPNDNLVALISEESEDSFSVLEVGCDLGANLLAIQSKYPNSKLHGVEINSAAVAIAKCLLDVQEGNIEEENLPIQEKFDYIIFGDVLEHLHNPQKTIRYCKQKLLKEHGHIIASIPNVMHISVMQQLLNGRFEYTDMGLLDRTHIHLFTYYEILLMFQQEDYSIEGIYGTKRNLTKEQEQLKSKLMELSENVEMHMYDTYQYVVKARS